MKKKSQVNMDRRNFIGNSLKASLGTAIAVNFPTIVPARVLGKMAPSNIINVASIGCGRISTSHDMTGVSRFAGARIMAVCDVDRDRAAAGPAAVKLNYEKQAAFNGGIKADWDIKVYHDYKELLNNKVKKVLHTKFFL